MCLAWGIAQEDDIGERTDETRMFCLDCQRDRVNFWSSSGHMTAQ